MTPDPRAVANDLDEPAPPQTSALPIPHVEIAPERIEGSGGVALGSRPTAKGFGCSS